MDRFYRFFEKLRCIPSHVTLFLPEVKEIEDFLLSQDILYVGGGSTRNLLALWREWGIDQTVRRAWEKGIVLAGISAGGICWFEEGVTSSNPGAFTGIQALRMLPGSFCPHYDGERDRRPSFHRLLLSGQSKSGIACDDGAAVHFAGTKVLRAVSSRREAKAYQVYCHQGRVEEIEFNMQFLGSETN